MIFVPDFIPRKYYWGNQVKKQDDIGKTCSIREREKLIIYRVSLRNWRRRELEKPKCRWEKRGKIK